jgi:hypothetical protein
MYIHTPFPTRYSPLTWKRRRSMAPRAETGRRGDSPNVATPYRGLAYGEQDFLQQADSTLVAPTPDRKVIWSRERDPKVGAVNTNAPHIFGQGDYRHIRR